MSKNHVDFYCLNCVYSLAFKKKSELHKKVCENKISLTVKSLLKSLKY